MCKKRKFSILDALQVQHLKMNLLSFSSEPQHQREHPSEQPVTELIGGKAAAAPLRSVQVSVAIRWISAAIKRAMGDAGPWTQPIYLLRR